MFTPKWQVGRPWLQNDKKGMTWLCTEHRKVLETQNVITSSKLIDGCTSLLFVGRRRGEPNFFFYGGDWASESWSGRVQFEVLQKFSFQPCYFSEEIQNWLQYNLDEHFSGLMKNWCTEPVTSVHAPRLNCSLSSHLIACHWKRMLFVVVVFMFLLLIKISEICIK